MSIGIHGERSITSQVRRNPYLDGARIGLIIPSVNTMTEPEFAWIAPLHMSFHAARVFLSVTTTEALHAMNAEVCRAAQLLATLSPNVIAYACTAGSFVDGSAGTDRLLASIRKVVNCPVVATASAMDAALRRLGVSRMSLATPYPQDVTEAERNFLVASGFDVVSCACLGRSGAAVRPTTFDEIIDLVRGVDRADSEAIFVSCTDLRVLEIVDVLERELGKPVLTSNQVTLWAILDVLGHREPLAGFGRLLSSQ